MRQFFCLFFLLIIDHGFKSEWAHYTDEEQKIIRMWSFLKYWKRKWHIHEAWQVFPDYNDLKEKMRDAGETALERIKVFEDKAPISIKMPYVLCRFRRFY